MVPTWKTKKENTSKFVDANERERERERESCQRGVGRQRTAEKENKIVTLDREICENIKNMYINKMYIYVYK